MGRDPDRCDLWIRARRQRRSANGRGREILGSAAQALKVFTDDRGFYSVASLVPGTYSVKASAPSFLPSLRDKIGVRAAQGSW